MDIIAKAAPDIDPERLQQSLQGFRDYMVDTLELIDFTLSNQKNRIIGAVSQENFDQLAMAVAALNSNVTALNSTMGQLSGLPAQVTDMQEQLTTLAGQVSAIKGRMDTAEKAIAAMNGTMDSLEARVAALEQASQ